ncbi:hypothetical protein [Vibrio sonorensis]|uniref:hypothetical protein n=1 Tax=Vibrio sonorensis TaxID=1004316 RepID=UPI0008D8DBE8|nr:hypothetical protein [Vibrio sonorensis]
MYISIDGQVLHSGVNEIPDTAVLVEDESLVLSKLSEGFHLKVEAGKVFFSKPKITVEQYEVLGRNIRDSVLNQTIKMQLPSYRKNDFKLNDKELLELDLFIQKCCEWPTDSGFPFTNFPTASEWILSEIDVPELPTPPEVA